MNKKDPLQELKLLLQTARFSSKEQKEEFIRFTRELNEELPQDKKDSLSNNVLMSTIRSELDDAHKT